MVWCKWIGLILIGIGLASVGFRMAYNQERRLEEYRVLQKMLMLLRGRMQMGESMEFALESCAASGTGTLANWFLKMSQRLSQRELLSDVWKEELKREKGNLHLEQEDYEILEELGRNLQGARLENCCDMLQQIQDHFHGKQKMLEQIIVEQGRLYRSIGILGGILAMVVLA